MARIRAEQGILGKDVSLLRKGNVVNNITS
jgi:hypothetical protein